MAEFFKRQVDRRSTEQVQGGLRGGVILYPF
jgi:hypothetical protein